MATDQQNRRTDSIRVRLSPEMMGQFEDLASRYGMPSATLCAFAVARFVQQENANVQLARMAVLDISRRAGIGMDMTDEQMERVFSPMLAQLVKEMSLSSLDRVPAFQAGK